MNRSAESPFDTQPILQPYSALEVYLECLLAYQGSALRTLPPIYFQIMLHRTEDLKKELTRGDQ